jgi:hypothetical protein
MKNNELMITYIQKKKVIVRMTKVIERREEKKKEKAKRKRKEQREEKRREKVKEEMIVYLQTK